MICLASLGLFFLIEKNIRSENIIFIIDGSASSKTLLNSNTRFEEAVDFAKKHLGNKNSIVLAKDVPVLILEDETSQEARKALNLASSKLPIKLSYNFKLSAKKSFIP